MKPTTRRRVLWSAALVYIGIAFLSRFGHFSTVSEAPQPWEKASRLGLFVQSGTYGLERTPDFYWIRDREIVLRIVNPTPDNERGTATFRIGPTVCGSRPRVVQIDDDARITKFQGGIVISVPFALGPYTHQKIRMELSARECQIPTDPRRFLGSLSEFRFLKS